MFLAVVLIIVKTWKEPKCPSVDGRINKHSDNGTFQTMEYYSVLKRKELSNHEKTTCCVIPTIQHPEKGKNTETIKCSVVVRAWE